MSSIVLMARGINQSFELWQKFMETKMFLWKRLNLKTNQEEATMVQGALRPIQLFEYVVPNECIPEALAMMGLHKNEKMRPEINNYAWILRKLMGLKKIEVPEEIAKKEGWQVTDKYVPMAGMAVYPIGVKEDVVQEYPSYGYKQEGL